MSLSSSFPRIRHLPGSHAAPDDLLWTADEARRFLTRPVVLVEKLDGINVTFSAGRGGRVDAALKSEWAGALDGAVMRAVRVFAAQRADGLRVLTARGAHFHAEWMWHRVAIGYDRLPDVVVGTSVMTRRGRFLERLASDSLIQRAGFAVKRPLFVGVLGSMTRLKALVRRSAFGAPRMEGLILTLRDDPHPETRWAKWVDHNYPHPPAGVLSGQRNFLAH